jgi:hypothetical protein
MEQEAVKQNHPHGLDEYRRVYMASGKNYQLWQK